MRPLYYVWSLQCSYGSLYVGHTTDLRTRLQAKNEGRDAAYTHERRPVGLAYSEPHTHFEAIRCERQLKRWTHQKKGP